MIDRTARSQLTNTLLSYMNEEINAFQFDDQLEEFRYSSCDKTVEIIARELWGCYDDCKDHKVVASKQTWNYFNRLLLLLCSDAELEEAKGVFHWHATQIVAGATLLLFVFSCALFGWKGRFLEIVWPLLGLLSMTISWFNRERMKKETVDLALYPFPSLSTLSVVRRNITGFLKRSYPKTLARRRIRHPIATSNLLVLRVVFWLIFSPFVLLLQALPARGSSEVQLKLPQCAG